MRSQDQAAQANDGRPLLRAEDVAIRCATSLRTVRSWISSGRLEVVRLSPRMVRVTETALADFMLRSTERGA